MQFYILILKIIYRNIKYIHSRKQDFYYSPPLFSFSILSLLFSFIYLPAVFAPYFSPFASLSFRRMCSIVSLSSRHLLHLLSPPSVPFLLSLSSFPPLNLAIIFLFHTHSLPSLLYFDCLILSLLSYLFVSLSLYLFIHLLLVHFLAGSSSSSPLLLLEIFLQFLLSLIPSKPLPVYLYFPVSYFHPFSSISLFSG
jgi:hypothetical protein